MDSVLSILIAAYTENRPLLACDTAAYYPVLGLPRGAGVKGGEVHLAKE